MRQQSIGGAPLAFRYEEMIVYLTVGPVFVKLATALLVRQRRRATQLEVLIAKKHIGFFFFYVSRIFQMENRLSQ